MSKYKKFALSPSGEIINRATGTLSRVKNLTVEGNRVYKNGRLYGYLGKQTKTQQKLSAELDKRRQKRREKARIKEIKRQVNDTTQKTYKVDEKPTKSKTSSVDNEDIIEDIIEENEEVKKTVDYYDEYDYLEDLIQEEPKRLLDILDEYEKEQIEEYTVETEIETPEFKPISEESLLMITDIKKWSKFIEDQPDILPEYKALKQEESNLARSIDARIKAGQIDKEFGDKIKERWKNATTDEERNKIWKDLKKNDPKEGFEYDPEIMMIDKNPVVID